jgi:hypothetical protein
MKTILVIGAALFTIATAQACEVNSAQFIGKVRDLKVVWMDQGVRDCVFKIEFTQFQPAFACPVYPGEATYREFTDYDCQRNLSNGDQVSGVILEKDGQYQLDW